MITVQQNLNVRHESKYLLDTGTYIYLRETLRKLMKLDSNTKNNKGYHIRSLYFDDIYDAAFKEKMAGLENRRKYRIRIYDFSDQIIKLEEKSKYHDYIHKTSENITKEEFYSIMNGDISFLLDSNSKLKTRYYIEMRTKRLTPKVIVDYHREAFILPYNQIRITFDNNLAVAKPVKNIFDSDIFSKRIGEEYEIILEVKYNNFLPTYIKTLLDTFHLNQLSASKYAVCRFHM